MATVRGDSGWRATGGGDLRWGTLSCGAEPRTLWKIKLCFLGNCQDEIMYNSSEVPLAGVGGPRLKLQVWREWLQVGDMLGSRLKAAPARTGGRSGSRSG